MTQETSANEYSRIQKEALLCDPDRYKFETEESARKLFQERKNKEE